jgi:hypothetical protein
MLAVLDLCFLSTVQLILNIWHIIIPVNCQVLLSVGHPEVTFAPGHLTASQLCQGAVMDTYVSADLPMGQHRTRYHSPILIFQCIIGQPCNFERQLWILHKIHTMKCNIRFWGCQKDTTHHCGQKRVQLFLYRAGQALRISGGWGSQNLQKIGTWRWQHCQPYAPATFNPRRHPWYSFQLEAESIPGP